MRDASSERPETYFCGSESDFSQEVRQADTVMELIKRHMSLSGWSI